MTAKDYLDRIRKAVSLERLDELEWWIRGDPALGFSDVKALMPTIEQRRAYLSVARIASTP